ncbi:MAG: hypothetical protein EBW20_02860 [Betaproteobacteria bacterium]|nr:hypothetical protein [Betaproteobacteria bacterium]
MLNAPLVQQRQASALQALHMLPSRKCCDQVQKQRQVLPQAYKPSRGFGASVDCNFELSS